MRLLVTAIIPGSQTPAKATIILRLLDGTTLDYCVPVQLMHHIPATCTERFRGQANIPPLVHTLFAHLLTWKVVTDSPSIPMHGSQERDEMPSRNILSNLVHSPGSQVYARHSSLLQYPNRHHRRYHGINESKVAKPRSRVSNAPTPHHGGSSTRTAISHGPGTKSGSGNGTQQSSDTRDQWKVNIKGSKTYPKQNLGRQILKPRTSILLRLTKHRIKMLPNA